MARTLAALALIAVAGCSPGTVSNDDDVSRREAGRAVERFFTAVHDGRGAEACARLPASQRTALARLSAARGGARDCARALATLREFAPAREAGPPAFSHDLRFLSALPHRATRALDRLTVNGSQLGDVGLRREGDTWSVAFVCSCR